MRDRRRELRIVAIAAAWLALAALPARARPPHKKALADYLGPGLARKLNDCRTCHVVPSRAPTSRRTGRTTPSASGSRRCAPS